MPLRKPILGLSLDLASSMFVVAVLRIKMGGDCRLFYGQGD